LPCFNSLSSDKFSPQQRKLNAFVKEYNELRPHEALSMRTSAAVQEKGKCADQYKTMAVCVIPIGNPEFDVKEESV